MSVIILLIVISVIVALFFLGVFIWAVKTGQFDDTVSPAIRILFEDKIQRKTNEDKEKKDGTEKSEEP